VIGYAYRLLVLYVPVCADCTGDLFSTITNRAIEDVHKIISHCGKPQSRSNIRNMDQGKKLTSPAIILLVIRNFSHTGGPLYLEGNMISIACADNAFVYAFNAKKKHSAMISSPALLADELDGAKI